MRFFKRAMLVFFALFLLWIGLSISKWLPPTTDVQRKAIAILEVPPAAAKSQHNAFAALWLVNYDIPAADLDKVMAADVAGYHEPGKGKSPGVFVSTAEGKFRKQPTYDISSALLCQPQGEDCLASVRSHVEAVRTFVASNNLLVDHARDLANDDSYRMLFPFSIYTPIPDGLKVGKLQITDAALRFADGDKTEGLVRACSAAATWRRLSTHTDSLIVQMVAIANFHGAADLFGDMLAEMPADATLPEACADAFKPVVAADLRICESMKSEYRIGAVLMSQVAAAEDPDSQPWVAGVLTRLLFNERATSAMRAVSLASYCTDDPEIQKEAARMRTSTWWQNGGVLGVLFNLVGSMETGMETGGEYSIYATRMQDLRGMNSLVEAALGLRGVSAPGASQPPAEERLRTAGALPAGVEWDAQQHLLHHARAYRRQDLPEKFSIPLPGSRVQ